MKTKTLRKWLIFWTIFIGVGAVWGMLMMLIDPSGEMWGMEPLLEFLQILPYPEIFFTNFIFSGIVLFLVNGVPQLATAFLLIRNNKYAPISGIASGIILIFWILFQLFVVFEPNPLSNIYLVFGVLETGNGILLYRRMLAAKV